ncbi:MAG TPA: hypothetical protein VGL08_21970 [Paraburkholderia sp.]
MPAGYIGRPHGNLQPDPRNPGIFFDDGGQRYLQSNGNPYAVKYDRTNDTWRAVQLDDPAKPGLPVKQDADGNWSSHSEVGGLGGDPVDPSHPNAQAIMHLQQQYTQLEQTHQALVVNEQNRRQSIADLEAYEQTIQDDIRRAEAPQSQAEAARPPLPWLWQELTVSRQRIHTLSQELVRVLEEQQFYVQQMEQTHLQLLQLLPPR